VSVLNRRFDKNRGHHHQVLMCGCVLRSHEYKPCLWTGGRGWFSTCVCPCLAIGALLGSSSILMLGRHVWLRLNPSSLLKSSGCNRISMASFTRRSMYLVAVPNLIVPSKLKRWDVVIECSATADFSGWYKRTCLPCSLSLASMDRPFCPT
jgi:hypothetical protein